MNDAFILDLIIMIGFAVFIFSRFFSTKLPKDPNKKGPEAGGKKRIDPHAKPAAKVVEMPRKPPVSVRPKKPAVSQEVLAKLEGAERLKAVDPSFDEKNFISGARQAFTLYWQAVAEKDEKTLDSLAGPKVFDDIMDKVEELEAEDRVLVTRIDKLHSVELVETRVNGRTEIAEVRYKADMAQSEVQASTKSTSASAKPYDAIWVWARNIDDTDPNWELEAINPTN